MGNRAKFLWIGIIAVLSIVAVCLNIHVKNKHDLIEDISEIKMQAMDLYKKGDINEAISSMDVYCQHVITDIEAKAVLGDWYLEAGQADMAYGKYYEAALSRVYTEEKMPALSVKNTEEILLEPIDEFVIEITPDVRMTKDMTLTITSHNLVPKEKSEGRVDGFDPKLTEAEDYYTTAWFDVNPEGEYLTMSGGFNCALWQFRDETGEIIAAAESTNSYRLNNTYSINVYQMARVEIPKKAIQCRVTYFNKTIEETTAVPTEELVIVYGRLPGESKKADASYYHIPDLKEGEKIVYEKSRWKMITENGEKILSDWKIPQIERGSYFSLGGTLPGKVSFEKCKKVSYAKDGIYTIRFETNSPTAMGERMDDAKNLGFNSTVGNTTITLGENHFDNIYPWKEIKLCAIKDGKITYSGEQGFVTNGESGDVFVEIPKFYVKRIVDDKYETISISGAKHEGFEVDPAFITKDGEKDKIYIAAYLTAYNSDGKLSSVTNVAPVMNMTPEEIKKNTESKGPGYKELDYAALGAVQKLFMVETGLRNSQYLYTGACAYTVASGNKNECILALNTKEDTNCIDIAGYKGFDTGNTIVLYNSDNYEESYETALGDVRKIKTVIDNGDDTYSIYFSGDSVTVTQGVTAIAHVGLENGQTRGLEGATAAANTSRGIVSFKYRNIENLWGNAYVYIDNVVVNKGVATITDRKGNSFELGFNLPMEESGEIEKCMIRTLGYDEKHPFVLLPSRLGEDATISTYYGDTYLHGKDDKEYVLHYGGGWNSQACAGLFSYASLAAATDNYTNTTGRMMYLP